MFCLVANILSKDFCIKANIHKESLVAQQKLQVPLNFSTCNIYQATSDQKQSIVLIRCSYGNKSTQLLKIDHKYVVGTFGLGYASADGEEIGANGSGNMG